MGTRPQAQLAGRKRLRMVMACLVGAAVAGLVVGMVAAVVAYTIGESSCPPEDDQCANGLLAGFGVGILAAAGATTISIFLLSLRARLGWTLRRGLRRGSRTPRCGVDPPPEWLVSAAFAAERAPAGYRHGPYAPPRRAAQSGDEGRWGS